MELSQQLLNISYNFYHMNGRNFDIIHSTLDRLIKSEAARNLTNSEHIRGWSFSLNLLKVADSLLSGRQRTTIFTQQFFGLLKTLNEYGEILAKLHHKIAFLRPFQFVGQKLGIFSFSLKFFIN